MSVSEAYIYDAECTPRGRGEFGAYEEVRP